MNLEVVFSDRNTPFAWLIRLVTRSKVSHVSFRVVDYFAYEAGTTGVSVLPWDTFKAKHTVLARYALKVERFPNADAALPLLLETYGDGYDYLGILGLGYCLLIEKLFNKNVPNPLNARSSYWCSELVSSFLSWAGDAKALAIDPDTVSPEDLLELFRSNPEYFQELPAA